jgi:hypothetical protein
LFTLHKGRRSHDANGAHFGQEPLKFAKKRLFFLLAVKTCLTFGTEAPTETEQARYLIAVGGRSERSRQTGHSSHK